jgi:hypothetical protein
VLTQHEMRSDPAAHPSPPRSSQNASLLGTILSALIAVAAIAIGFGLRTTFSGPKGQSLKSQACEIYFSHAKLCASLQWLPGAGPAPFFETHQPSRFILSFRHAVNGTIAGASISPPGEPIVSLWMPGMGHGSENTVVTPQTALGEYLVDHVVFSMRGEWEIWVTLLEKGQFIEKAKLNLNL